jgi:hypothetical protein
VTAAGEAIYAHLDHLEVDAGSDALLRALCEGVGMLVERARTIAIGTDTARPGQLMWDPAIAPRWMLPWLAQLSGAILPAQAAGEPEADYLARARTELIYVSGWRRGTAKALREAPRYTLTGDRTVILRERYDPGNPTVDSEWHTMVVTYESQTPDPAATLATLANAEQTPAGVKLHHAVLPGQDFEQIRRDFATFVELRDAYAGFTALRDDERGE